MDQPCKKHQHANPSLDIPYSQKPEIPKQAQNANQQPPRPRTKHQTAHIKCKHPENVWSLGSLVKYSDFSFTFIV